MFNRIITLALLSCSVALGGEYPATVTSVYDGDTITAHLELGLDVVAVNQKLRLYGINAPEMRGDEKAAGTVARDWLRKQIYSDPQNVSIRVVEDKRGQEQRGKYGRWLVIVYVNGRDMNKALLDNGMAKPYTK